MNEADMLQDLYTDQLYCLSAGLVITSPTYHKSIGSKLSADGRQLCIVEAFSSPATALEMIQPNDSQTSLEPLNGALATTTCLLTSGSTGTQKGALHTNESLSLLAAELENLLNYDETDRFLVCSHRIVLFASPARSYPPSTLQLRWLFTNASRSPMSSTP